ncbi:unnamed protein product [Polarella glacialis]|uniref:JmjC domain-containing protein n=1 Tax=Polarella glacialis TaxID=89957 RepID=A0A813KVV4_POLGL|nr:unnamed protein product [Polarella glacialis]
MVAVFGAPPVGVEGPPVEIVARSFHEKLLRRMSSWRSMWLDQAWFGALTGAMFDVAQGFNGVQPIVAVMLLVGRRVIAGSSPGARICLMSGPSIDRCCPVAKMEMEGAACCFHTLPAAAPEELSVVTIALTVGDTNVDDRPILSWPDGFINGVVSLQRCWAAAGFVLLRVAGSRETQDIERVAYADLTFDQAYRFRAGRQAFYYQWSALGSVCLLWKYREPSGNSSGDPFYDYLSRMDAAPGVRKGSSFFAKISMFHSLGWSHVQAALAKCKFPSLFHWRTELLLHSVANGKAYSEERIFPTFYWSQKGFRQAAHVDIPLTELWSALCRGKKWYYITPLSVAKRLLGVTFDELRNMHHNPDRFSGLPIWQGALSPGEVLYMPAWAIHAIMSEEDSVNIINNFIDVGDLGPVSQGNVQMLKESLQSHVTTLPWPHADILRWLEDPSSRVRVFDGQGPVAEGNVTARGFPSWNDLLTWAAQFQPRAQPTTITTTTTRIPEDAQDCFRGALSRSRCCKLPIDWRSCWAVGVCARQASTEEGSLSCQLDMASECCGFDFAGRGVLEEDLASFQSFRALSSARANRLESEEQAFLLRRFRVVLPSNFWSTLAANSFSQSDDVFARCCFPPVDWRWCWLQPHYERLATTKWGSEVLWHPGVVHLTCESMTGLKEDGELARAKLRELDLVDFLLEEGKGAASHFPPQISAPGPPVRREVLIYGYRKVGTCTLEDALGQEAVMFQTHRHDVAASIFSAMRPPCTVISASRDPRTRSPSEFFDRFLLASPFQESDFSYRELTLAKSIELFTNAGPGEDVSRIRALWRNLTLLMAEVDPQAAIKDGFRDQLRSFA